LSSVSNKDFRVKYGIQVGGDAIVNGNITLSSDPTQNLHVATKQYVDSIAMPIVSGSIPESPQPGQLWLDSVSERLHVFDGQAWIALATIEDANYLQDHIHDTSIEGDGRIVSIFVDAGSPTSTFQFIYDALFPETTDWSDTWSGGIAVDNFN
jgi:hypothetical protein